MRSNEGNTKAHCPPFVSPGHCHNHWFALSLEFRYPPLVPIAKSDVRTAAKHAVCHNVALKGLVHPPFGHNLLAMPSSAVHVQISDLRQIVLRPADAARLECPAHPRHNSRSIRPDQRSRDVE